ncbi:hypothetical protein HBH98_230530 [Parastagonospora nodorum]|nr:hypothetical protein HBH49_236110 [Parastagonospora nodorum]KAH4336231.1 hypothetical protein HBH98_230530 [Parastagonospora nodorum]KAH4357639.1 hypothetical protein HBH97_221720 [Parastagonospora nodorum]KAH4372351.1 hypothetical protein HBH99_233200 [Parastagonospora nodorum]KAH5045849.1 hypothetical protein HBH96_242920 [Parastagonospora nodorum]
MLFHTTHLSAYLVFSYGLGREVQAQFDIGTASSFSIIASSAITNTGSTVIDGQIAVFPNNPSSVTGFPSGTVIASSDISSRAKEDARAAYIAARSLYPTKDITGQDLGGQLLTPWTYFASSVGITGALILDGKNVQDAQFVFQIGSTLKTAKSSSLVLINGAQAYNVVWQIGSSATLGIGTAFQGNIITQDLITLVTGTTVNGGLYALTGAITLDTNRITAPQRSSQQPTRKNPTSKFTSSVSQITSRVVTGSGRTLIPTTGTSINDITTSLILSIATDFSKGLTTMTRVPDEVATESSPNASSDSTATSLTGNMTIASLETETPNTQLSSKNTTYKTFSVDSTYWKFSTTTLLSPFTTTDPKTTSTQVQIMVSSNDLITTNSGTSSTNLPEYLPKTFSSSSTAVVPVITPTISPEISVNTGTRLARQTPLGLPLPAILFALLVLS